LLKQIMDGCIRPPQGYSSHGWSLNIVSILGVADWMFASRTDSPPPGFGI
jgi:hypothetical protein